MHKIKFKKNFTEPIILSGEILGIKLLSAFEIASLKNDYKKFTKIYGCGLNKIFLKKASIVTMCLYDSSKSRVFFDIFNTLKTLTPGEINLIYNEYIKLNRETHRENKKMSNLFGKIKSASLCEIYKNKKDNN